MKKKISWLVATWFGSGLSPIAPGTAGSLAALPFAYVIQLYLGNAALFIASVCIFFIGWWASNEYLRHNPDNKDPGEIVVDEVAGQWLVLAFIYGVFPLWLSFLIAFLLFRMLDIFKPWPASWADTHVKGGLGVMLDDILAALYGVLIGLGIQFFFSS